MVKQYYERAIVIRHRLLIVDMKYGKKEKTKLRKRDDAEKS